MKWLGAPLLVLLFNSPFYSQATNVDEIDLIHYGDNVDVDVIGSSDYDWRGGIAPDGTLDGFLSYGEPIRAICRETSAIAKDVETALSKILRSPSVKVKIVDRSNRAVLRVIGAVRNPTRFRLMRPVSLREIIVRTGGFTDEMSGEIAVFRPRDLNCETPAGGENNAGRVFRIKISDLLKGDEAANIRLSSGDTVEIERATPVYVIGAVNSPRPVYSRAEMTLSRAIASAGGLAKDADAGKITIFRRENGDSRTFETDLGKIKLDASADIVLKPFDIIDVAGRGGGKRKLPPVVPETENSTADKRELPLRVIDHD